MYKLEYIFKKYFFTVNHKRIALNYLYFSMFTGLVGVYLATLIRIELATPGLIYFYGDSTRYLQVVTLHALVMIFYVAIPLLFGFVANFFIPYHIGAKDVAFPRLNSIAFWLLPLGFTFLLKAAFLRQTSFYEITPLLVNAPFFKSFEFPTYKMIAGIDTLSVGYINNSNNSQVLPGWTFITPLSSNLLYTGKGPVDLAIISILFLGLSSTIGFTNLLITRRVLASPGFETRKNLYPFFTINLFLCMRMLALITPILGAGMFMLLSDRHFGTSFFDYTYGGDTILFQHIFWFFGHPEVYVLLIPCFGIISYILADITGKRFPSKNHMIWATYAMAYMGFLVWGHHMYLVGLDHRSRSLYSTITIMISLPAVVKIINWTGALLNTPVKGSTPLYFIIAFLLFFLSGGLTGMWLSHVAMNLYTHDTFYVVAHFHMLFSASLFSSVFALLYHYYYIIFDTDYNRVLANIHFALFFSGQWLTFLPLYYVGYNGLPRRYLDYPAHLAGWQGLSSSGHVLTLISIVFFFVVLGESFIVNRRTLNIDGRYSCRGCIIYQI